MIDYTKRPKPAAAPAPTPATPAPAPAAVRVEPRALPVQLGRDPLHQRLFAWLAEAFENVYPNPQNAIIVPFDTTTVVVDSDEFVDGRRAVQLRSAILQDVRPNAELFEHVAHQADRFKIGGLYLYPEGHAYDLDFSIKVLHAWLDPETLVRLVTVAGSSAIDQADQLFPRFGGHVPNPGGQSHQRAFMGAESRGRQDVWDALERALDTQRCDVIGTAERIALDQTEVLVGGWFVLANDWLWVAGRRERGRDLVVWRVPRPDITATKCLDLFGLPTFVAHFGRGQKMCVGTATVEAVTTLEQRCH